jgi:tetratricopeptide (TPR) repeat protein
MPLQRAAARATVTRRPLAAPDVHLLWARLTRWGGGQDAAAKRDLDEALAEAPDAAAPHYWMGLYALSHDDVRKAELDLAEAIRKAPRDPRFRLGMVLLRARLRGARGPSDLAEVVDRLGEVAETTAQLRAVAAVDRELKRADQAMEFAKKAYALAPFDPLVLDTYAAILFDQEHFEAAVAMQRKAVALLPEDVALPAFFERLRAYEARVAAAHDP